MGGHTKGRTVIGASGTSVWTEDGVTRIAACNTPLDAAFVSEALNVAHETGRTPRQLADERAELVAALEVATDRQGFTQSEWLAARKLLALAKVKK